MGRWRATAIVLGVALAMLDAATPSIAAQPQSSQTTELGARRPHRHLASRVAPYEPRYYARPYYYRPYPYGVPYPFVLGFGPWW